MKILVKFWKEWRSTIVLGTLILLIAFCLRIYNLTLLPVFGDEAIYIRWSQIMNVEPGLRFVPLSDGKQPFFMWVLMFLVNRFSDPLFIGRFTSALYGMGTIFGIFLLSYYLFRSKKISLIASLFWSISPYCLFYDRLALVDSMLAMFGVWTLLFAVVTAKTLRIDTAILTGFALGGALLTKSPAIFFVILLPTTWIVANWPKRKKNKPVSRPEAVHLLKLIFLSLISYVIACAMYNILRLGENFHLISSRNQDYIFPISHLFTSPFDPFIANIKSVYQWLWMLGPSLILVFVMLYCLSKLKLDYLKAKKRIRPEVGLVFIWSIFPIVVAAVYAKVFTARYILFTLPTLFIFASLIFSYLFSKRGLLKKVLIFGLALYVYQALKIDYQLLTNPSDAPLPRVLRSGYLEEWTAGTGIKEISEYIRAQNLELGDQKIVVGTEGYFGTLPDGLQIYLNDLRDITVIGTGLDFTEIPESLIESSQAGNKTYFVVNSSRLKVSPCALGVKFLKSYPKAVKPDGTHEALYLFEVSE